MDGAGVSRAILSISGPGVQVEPDTARATRYGALLDPLRVALANVIADPTRGVMPPR